MGQAGGTGLTGKLVRGLGVNSGAYQSSLRLAVACGVRARRMLVLGFDAEVALTLWLLVMGGNAQRCEVQATASAVPRRA
jgi:hypothetical protein